MTRITYISDQAGDYVAGLQKCNTLKKLQEFTYQWLYLAADAAEIAESMDHVAFGEYERGRALERKGEFAGEDWAENYGAILMPNVLFQVSIIANHFRAPWGTAFIRLKELGKIKEETRAVFGDDKQTIAVWVEDKAEGD